MIGEAKLREHIAEKLVEVSHYLDSAVSMLAIGDDDGAAYAIDKLACNFKIATDRFFELLKDTMMEKRKEEAYERAQRRSVRHGKDSQPHGYGDDAHLERFRRITSGELGDGELGDDTRP